MRLPSFKRIIKTDYANEYQDLVEQLASSINIGMDNLYIALNKNISLKDNVLCTVKDIDVTLLSTGAPKEATSIVLDFNTSVTACMVGRADNLTNTSVYPTGGVFISFTQNANRININNITGLPANYKFRLKVIVFG